MMTSRCIALLSLATFTFGCGPSGAEPTDIGTGSSGGDTGCVDEIEIDGYFHVKEEDFESLRSVRRVSGSLSFQSLEALEDLEFLRCLERVEGSLILLNNPKLRSIAGLERLEYVGDGLTISGAEELSSLSGLDQLSSVGVVRISANPKLETVAGFGSLSSLAGLSISGNGSLVDLGFGALGTVGTLRIGACDDGDAPGSSNKKFVEFRGLPAIRSIDSLVVSAQHSLISLAPLQRRVEQGLEIGTLKFQFNISLPNDEIQRLADGTGAHIEWYLGCAESGCPCGDEVDGQSGAFCAYELSCGNQGDESCPCDGQNRPCPAVCGVPE